MRKPILSPTKIATYLECAVKYRYIYLDKIGRYYLKAKPDYSFGSTLHQVLESFHQKGAGQTSREVVEEYSKAWITSGYESPNQEAAYHAEGIRILEEYHSAAASRADHRIKTVMAEETVRCDMGRFILAGRVDRVDRYPDGTLEIVDYKSGRWEITPKQVANDLALNAYQLILRRMHPDARAVSTIYCLRSGIQASSEMGPEEREMFAIDIRMLGEEIIDRDFEYVEPVRIEACAECEFRERCERFWEYQARLDSFE